MWRCWSRKLVTSRNQKANEAGEGKCMGLIKKLLVSGGGVCTEIITSIVEYFFCLLNYNSTCSSLEDVVSGPGVLSEPLSCQACAWLELRWGNPSRIPKNMCIYPWVANIVYPKIFFFLIAFLHMRWDSQIIKAQLQPYENRSFCTGCALYLPLLVLCSNRAESELHF